MPSPEPSLAGPEPFEPGEAEAVTRAWPAVGAGAESLDGTPSEGQDPSPEPAADRAQAPAANWQPDLAAADPQAIAAIEGSDDAASGAPIDTASAAPLPAPQAGPLAPPRQLSMPARLEAILYLKGKPLTLGELAEIAAVPRQEAELALVTLMADYAHRDTALEIRQEGQRYSLQLRDSLGDLVQSLLPVDLSTAALRTLATIALKKRILQSDLVELRGSGAYDHIKELLAQNFIERKRQSEGRSYWLSLSEKFHRTFAVTTVAGPARPSAPRGPARGRANAKAADPDGEAAGPEPASADATGSGPPGASASGAPDAPIKALGLEDSAWETPA